jgi:hypothetical protein
VVDDNEFSIYYGLKEFTVVYFKVLSNNWSGGLSKSTKLSVWATVKRSTMKPDTSSAQV